LSPAAPKHTSAARGDFILGRKAQDKIQGPDTLEIELNSDRAKRSKFFSASPETFPRAKSLMKHLSMPRAPHKQNFFPETTSAAILSALCPASCVQRVKSNGAGVVRARPPHNYAWRRQILVRENFAEPLKEMPNQRTEKRYFIKQILVYNIA